VSDRNSIGREGYITPGVAQLSDGDEGLHCKVGNDVSMSGRWWKAWNVKVSFMRGVEDDAGWGVNGDRGCGWMLVAHRRGRRKEVHGTTQISNGIKWSGGRTGDGSRK